MFLDAILNARLYATENGLVKLWYTVNGCMPATTLPLAEKYHFHVDMSYFIPPNECEKTSFLEVVSDYGAVVYSQIVEPFDNLSLDFTIHSTTARYFFLRLHSKQGDRTWSPAIWTGRAFDPCPIPEFKATPISKSEMRIVSCTPGSDPQLLISGNPDVPWLSASTTAEFVFDLGQERNICAIGIWPHTVDRRNPEISETVSCARFVSSVECFASCDGVYYDKAGSSLVRSHGNEHRLQFDTQAARYVKVTVTASTGSASRKPKYQAEPVMIAEVDIYEEK